MNLTYFIDLWKTFKWNKNLWTIFICTRAIQMSDHILYRPVISIPQRQPNYFHKLRNEPAHVKKNGTCYTDLNSGFHASLYLNHHYEIFHASFNLNIIQSQPYQCLICDSKKEDTSNMKKTLDLINWEKNLVRKGNFVLKNHKFNKSFVGEWKHKIWFKSKIL